MSNVKNVYIFGSMKDGFKASPSTSQFDHLYNNALTGWQIAIDRLDNIVRYTFVLYDVLTSTDEGRSGSCFGIAIDMDGYFFAMPKQLFPDLFDLITKNVIKEAKILTRNPVNHKVAYVAFNFTEIQTEVDSLIQRIRFYVDSNFNATLIKINNNIPNKGKESMGLHPDSSELAIMDMFTQYGSVILSPRFNLMKNSYVEVIQHKDALILKLKDEIERLNSIQLEFDQYKKSIGELKKSKKGKPKDASQIDNSIINLTPESVSNEVFELRQQLAQKDNELALLKIQLLQNSYKDIPNQRPESPSKIRGVRDNIFYGLAIGIIIVVIISVFILFSDKDKNIQVSTSPKNKQTEETSTRITTNSTMNEERMTSILNDDYLYMSSDGNKVFLNIGNFLKKMTSENKSVADADECIEEIVNYLWNSEQISKVYSNKSYLLEFIKNNNTDSVREIEKFIKGNLKGKPSVPFNNGDYWYKAIGANQKKSQASLIVYQKTK